ncbi:hypothetical protein BGX23_004654 [Mortierella sp. AD031]|nr:hypothetical protein BGX23_004654 [Mortierella sp. AD031]
MATSPKYRPVSLSHYPSGGKAGSASPSRRYTVRQLIILLAFALLLSSGTMLVFHAATGSLSLSSRNNPGPGCRKDADFSVIRWRSNQEDRYNGNRQDPDRYSNNHNDDHNGAGSPWINENDRHSNEYERPRQALPKIEQEQAPQQQEGQQQPIVNRPREPLVQENNSNDNTPADETAPEEEGVTEEEEVEEYPPFENSLDARDTTQYITYLPYAGITNQFYGMLRGMEVAKALGRTLIIPPITASSHDKSKQNQPWSKFLDLDRFQELTGAKVIEFHKLRDVEQAEFNQLQCRITCGFGSKRTIDFTAKGFLKQWKLNVTLNALSVDANKFDTITKVLAPHRRDKYICISNTYKISIPDKSEWDRFGQHLHFTQELEDFVQEYLDKNLEKPEPVYDPKSRTNKYIAIHARRGDFAQYCEDNFKGPKMIHCLPSTEEFAARIDMIQAKFNPTGSLKGILPVFVATNERRPEELKKFADLGWSYLDHDQMGTVERLGVFGPMMVDQVFMAHAQALVGIQMSTFSRVVRTTFPCPTMIEATNAIPAPAPAPSKATTTTTRGPAPYALSDLILIPATAPEVIQQTWTNNMEEWAKGVPLEKYHARERHLASTAFSSDGRLITWVLVPKPGANVTDGYAQVAAADTEAEGAEGAKKTFVEGSFDPMSGSVENLRRILGAVETYERPGLVATVAEGVKDVSSISVASVYVPSKYRHHGYGHYMMKLLWEEMEKKGTTLTFLYSDLGPDFYGEFGWTARTCTQITIPTTYILPTSPAVRTRSSVKPIALDPVATDAQLQELIDQDALLVRQDLQRRLTDVAAVADTNGEAKKTIVAVTPEIRAFQWLYARSWFNASHIVKSPKQPTASEIQSGLNYGIRIPGTTTQFVLWHHDFTDDNLFILRWRLDPSTTTPDEDTDAIALAFAQAAIDEAKKWNISKVVFWNGDAELATLLGLEVKVRKDSIPSLGLLNKAAYPDHNPANLEWVINQKYSWC